MTDTSIRAFFVAGPQNGTIMQLPVDTREYRFPRQRTLAFLKECNEPMRIDNLRVDLYERTSPLVNPFHRGCYVFEWMGER